MSALPRLILVHGSFHGPWCWSPILRALEGRGYALATPDLHAGVGLDGYARIVAAAIDAASGPVIVIGHSMGGIVTSAVSEIRSERILGAIYIAGLLLRGGETLLSFLDAHAALGVEDLVLQHMTLDATGEVATFPAAQAQAVFYNRCSDADAAWAAAQLRPQPVSVYAEPLTLTDARHGRVPRFYLGALDDHAVSPAYQRAMTERTPCEDVVWLDSDHSPFLSQPAALIDALQPILARLLLRADR